jgi:hypothetical protein
MSRSHIRMSHVTYMNESYRSHERVSHTYGWVMSRTCLIMSSLWQPVTVTALYQHIYICIYAVYESSYACILTRHIYIWGQDNLLLMHIYIYTYICRVRILICRHSYTEVMSHNEQFVTAMNESFTRVNESCHTSGWVMSRTCLIMSSLWQPRSCHTHEWVMLHIWMSHVTHMNESCYTHEWVMLHTWMSHVSYMNESCLIMSS